MEKSPYYQRAPRVKKAVPTKEITIHQPDQMPQAPTISVEQLLFSIITTGASIGLFYFISQKVSTGNSNYMLFMLASSVPMVLSSIFPFFMHWKNKRIYKRQLQKRETVYRGHLANHASELEDLQGQHEKILLDVDPSPTECVRRVKDRHSTLWERSPESEDFLHLRVGLGNVPFQVKIKAPTHDGYDKDPLIEEVQKITTDFKYVKNSPIRLPLFKSKIVGIVGDQQDVLGMQRLLSLQLATHHSPDEVKLAAFFNGSEKDQWTWLRWLPHTWDDEGQIRLLADEKLSAEKLSEKLFSTLNIRKIYKEGEGEKKLHLPTYAIFMAAKDFVEEDPIYPLLLKDADTIGACTFLFANRKEELPMQCKQIIEINSNTGTLIQTFSTGNESFEETEFDFIPDKLSLEEAERMARYMAPVKLKQSASEAIPKVLTLFDMFNIKKVEELNVTSRWGANRYPQSLPVPIGVRAGGKEVILNIHDKIEQNGHGPHGLMAGTTGSGKSEVIQSIIASLAVSYHPHEMAFMLIDYKGGGMSNTFKELPHVIATVTNLVDGDLIERAKISLKAELVRRQKVFNEAGGIQHIDEYYRSPYKETTPLPHLFIVIDEFAQLKKEQPEFMDELISIAAIGRTLGVHLLLATQKPAGVVDDKIWSNSRFRICLRVQDDADSRDMLKIPNASKINVPGRGYLQVGSDEVLDLFQSAYSGAEYNPDGDDAEVETDVYEVLLNGTIKKEKKEKKGSSKPKQLQVLNEYLKQVAETERIKPLPSPWLDPLPKELFFEELYELNKWSTSTWNEKRNWLKPVIGKVDDVANQQQYPLELELEEGHMAVYGMPGTGKTTFLQTLALSLAVNHSPRDLQIYMLDFGRMLRDFAQLPHVGGVVQEDEREKTGRLFSFLLKELDTRKELFSEEGAKTLTSYRQATGESLPAIFVFIDGYLNFRSAFEPENELLEQLLREGASLGIYFVITANKVNDIYEKMRSNIPLAVSYELADPSDYYFAVGRPTKAPTNLPEGRGLVKGHIPPLMFQTALTTKGDTEAERTNELRALIRRIQQSWQGELAKPIPVLPEEVSLQPLLGDENHVGAGFPAIPVGVHVADLSPHKISLQEGPYYLVGGTIEGGKTTALNSMILSSAHHISPEDLHLYLVDVDPKRRGILSIRNMPHVKGFATDEMSAIELLSVIRNIIDSRNSSSSSILDELDLEEADVTERKYPAVVLVIDDLEKFNEILTLSFDLQDQLDYVLKHGRGKDFYGFFAGDEGGLQTIYDNWLKEIKKSQAGYLLGTTNNIDMLFKIRLPHTEMNQELSTGEGFFVTRRYAKVKMASPFTNDMTPKAWVEEISKRWEIAKV